MMLFAHERDSLILIEICHRSVRSGVTTKAGSSMNDGS